ncbi:GspMb/PilO family protein [Samsonia erythrinae]|uniref:Type II secretion system (T2SS) protein M subtype b n=1 Tax=Samsonia erythrinae TaxID=160434 RepID=A0A4R3VMH6_9GAMM|nr:GspMb/PilO family protein [Samsonia erythrinae]TCV05175.1 type II secretion system (T2SS) protein M subtype b [Samsonia erythrinae]
MIKQQAMIDIVLGWPGLMAKPLWQQIVMQLIVVVAAGTLSCWLLIGGMWRAVWNIEEQTVRVRLDIQQIRQQIDAMPPLAELQMQLAQKTAPTNPFQPAGLAQRIAEPLSQAGAMLLSWQPAPPHTDSFSQARWQLVFSASYTGVLQVLRELTGWPYVLHVLRIGPLTLQSDDASDEQQTKTQRLRVELSLSAAEDVR